MSTANSLQTSAAPTSSRSPSSTTAPIGHFLDDSGIPNGHQIHYQEGANAPNHSSTNMHKKTKAKKMTDPNEASKLIADKISQLELDADGEKEKEEEIGG